MNIINNKNILNDSRLSDITLKSNNEIDNSFETIIDFFQNNDFNYDKKEGDESFFLINYNDFLYEKATEAFDLVNKIFSVKKPKIVDGNIIKSTLETNINERKYKIKKQLESFDCFINTLIKWHYNGSLIQQEDREPFSIDEAVEFFDELREIEDGFLMVSDDDNYTKIKDEKNSSNFIFQNNYKETENFNFFHGEDKDGKPHGPCFYRADNETVHLAFFDQGKLKSRHPLNEQTLLKWPISRLRSHDKILEIKMTL